MRKPGGVALLVLEKMSKGKNHEKEEAAGDSEGLKSASADLLSAITSGDAGKFSAAFKNMHHIVNGENHE